MLGALIPSAGVFSAVIYGPPTTKKNSQRVFRVRGRIVIAQSSQACAWEESAILQLQAARNRARFATTEETVNLRAAIYRQKNVGDMLNYLAAISDALERAGVVKNDRQIVKLDGCQFLVDKVRPRVELEITALAQP